MPSSNTRILPISAPVQTAMRGVTWHEPLHPPPFDELRVLELPFFDFQGRFQHGRMIAHADLADSIIQIFSRLLTIRFPIASMRPMFEFGGDDGLSMAANNTSCFNSRRIRGTHRLSLHSLGAAIDINPVQNPVLRDGQFRPDAGKHYLRRRDVRPGMLVPHCDALIAFIEAGWQWGGLWNNPVDYHHLYRVQP